LPLDSIISNSPYSFIRGFMLRPIIDPFIMSRLSRGYLRFVPVVAGLILGGSSVLARVPPVKPYNNSTTVAASEITPDELFVQLREASQHNDANRAIALAARLTDYPIPSYVQYFRIKPRLFDGTALRPSPVDDEVRDFLRRYDGEAIADRLRNDWLLILGKRRDWGQFDAEYARFTTRDDPQVHCYAQLSLVNKGIAIGDDGRRAVAEAKVAGEACSDLVAGLVQRNQIAPVQVRAFARWALENNNAAAARRIAALLPPTPNEGAADNDTVGLITRLARTDLDKAATQFATLSTALPVYEQAMGWATLGQFAAKSLRPEAVDYFRRQIALGQDVLLSYDSQEWKVRAALRAGDWAMVRQGIETMSPELRRKDPAWTYWLGRALRIQGDENTARDLFRSLAGQFHFYGQLATEELGQRIQLPTKTTVSETEINAVSQYQGFIRAQKLYELNLRFEGNREWNWILRGLKDRQLLAAAEYAKRMALYDRAVNTADRTQNEHDFSLRFLMPFKDLVLSTAQRVGLDAAWAYGLIRQESRFILNAKSSVGAQGLMQVMHATGKWVAKKIGLTDFQPSQLSEMQTNILIGSHYLQMVYTDLDNHPALASAAYNAGPGRPKAWRASLPRGVEGAIFAETIPFSETRGYVKNVLSNTTFYAALMTGQTQSLKARLGTVSPKPIVNSNLP
jgi:soluble lytic murein transglycosylase